MQVLLADEYGFCFGVERAVEMVEEALGEGDTVRSLGPLIHNEQEMERPSFGDRVISRSLGSCWRNVQMLHHETVRLCLVNGCRPLVFGTGAASLATCSTTSTASAIGSRMATRTLANVTQHPRMCQPVSVVRAELP